MLFQIVQNDVYANDTFSAYNGSTDLTHTWDFNHLFHKLPIECAHLWAGGQTLDSVCPAVLKDEWNKNRNKLRAFIRSFKEAGIDVNSFNLRQIVPERFLRKYLQTKNRITEHIFETKEKPVNYDFMFDLFSFTSDIERQKLNLDYTGMEAESVTMKAFLNNIPNMAPRVAYNPYGTITGRLGIQKGSFPILNAPKEARRGMLPNNDCFIELDFNAAELRTLLALSGLDQPEEDIHAWNAKHVFKDQSLSRDEIKRKTFSWLYNEKAIDKSLKMCYNKKHVKDKFFNGFQVATCFDRQIKADADHALNYIIQSTASDLFLKQAIKIWKELKSRSSSSKVAFTIHDSLIIDFCLEDKLILKELVTVFSETELGTFKVNVSAGKNFGEMKDLNI